jgi:hypothetical protein
MLALGEVQMGQRGEESCLAIILAIVSESLMSQSWSRLVSVHESLRHSAELCCTVFLCAACRLGAPTTLLA